MASKEGSVHSQTVGDRKGLEEKKLFSKNVAVIQAREGEEPGHGVVKIEKLEALKKLNNT